MDCFHYVTYGIFALWFSLNQVFVIKFSVSFATVVEVFARQKTLREKLDTFLLQRSFLSPPTDSTHGLKSLLFNMLESLYLCLFNA